MKKFSMLKQAGIAGLLVMGLLHLSGCVAAAVTGAAAAGGAGVAYVMGTLRADMQAMPMQIADATRKAFNVLAIKVEEFRATELDAIITGHTANNEKITVKIERETATVSELTIHVGIFGDEAFSNLIYEEITRQLSSERRVLTHPVPAASSESTFQPAPPTLAPASPPSTLQPSTTPAPTGNPHTTTPAPSVGTPVAY